MDKAFKLAALTMVTLVWFVLGTIMLIRSSIDISHLEKHKGEVERVWTDIARNYKGRPSDILLFKIKGLDQFVGISLGTIDDYDFFIDRIKPNDVITVYFDRQGKRTSEGYNLHIRQLEKFGVVLLDNSVLKEGDRKDGLILYGIGLVFSIGPIWFYRKRWKT